MAANILAGLGALSIIYGAYNALAMTDLKKLVAYSSVSHMGFVLLGIAAFTAEGWQGVKSLTKVLKTNRHKLCVTSIQKWRMIRV